MTTEPKTQAPAKEFNVRLWKTENGWKVTTTVIDGGSRDVTSKLRPTFEQASEIAQSFYAEQEQDTFVPIGNIAADLLNSVEVTNVDLGDVQPDEGDDTPDHIVEAMNASILANDGFRKDRKGR